MGAALVAVPILVVCTVATTARALGWERGPLLVLVALTPWVAGLAVFGLVLGLVARRISLIVLMSVLVIVQLSWLAPLYVPDPGTDAPVALAVATVNIGVGPGDADAIVEAVRTRGVSVLSVQELSVQSREDLRAAGLDELLPYHVGVNERIGNGTWLWSRTPVTMVPISQGPYSSSVVATGVIGGRPLTIVGVHPTSPERVSHDRWTVSTDELMALLTGIDGPVLVAGDFNTTRDQTPLLELERQGFRDAPDEAGAGLHMTFQVGQRVPPFVAIDHVMVRSFTAVARSVEALDIPGSDHRMLVVTYA